MFVSCANSDTPKPEVKKLEKTETKSEEKIETKTEEKTQTKKSEKTQTQASVESEEKIPKVLPANYLFEGDYINIHSPNSTGWSVVDKSESRVVLGKDGDKGRYIAEVIFFSILTADKKDFFDSIQKETSKISNDKRYSVLSSEFNIMEERNYPCVLSKQLIKDKKAQTSSANTEILMTQIKSLYCTDPKNKGAGFMIGYSFRGQEIAKDIDKQADSFIAGVEFP